MAKRKKSRTESLIRKHFNLPPHAELMYNNKGFQKDAEGKPLRGWFLNQDGDLRYLGRSFIYAISLPTVKHAAVIPRST